MTKRNRQSLKKRFGDGEMPSASDFGDLIESVLNIHDDGIIHNERDGLRLTQIGGDGRVLSLYGAVEEESEVWAFGLDQQRGCLTLDVGRRSGGHDEVGNGDEDGGGHAMLTLLAPRDPAYEDARVGINTADPRWHLDVNGVVASLGRVGAAGRRAARANAEWQTIGGPYRACTALEVVAGVGKQGSGKYALMHAFAMRAFDAKGEFTYHQAHYGSRRHRLELRWIDAGRATGPDKAESEVNKAPPGTYFLQIRVNCAYGDDVWIHHHLTTLWFDPEMAGSSAAPVAGDAP